MNLTDYHMVRYSTPALYTFEFVVAVAVGIVVAARWKRTGDARPMAVYVIAGLYDSVVELLAQGSGVRAVPEARLFGALPLDYPFLPFVLGFFEGGVLLLTGYEILRAVQDGNRAAGRAALTLGLGLFALISIGAAATSAQLRTDPGALAVTSRALFSRGSLLLLALCYGVSLAYVFLGRGNGARERRGLAVWYVGVALVAAVWYTPVFVAGVRVIGTLHEGAYVPVGPLEQIAVLYGYSIVFEAAGFYLPVYVILRLVGLR